MKTLSWMTFLICMGLAVLGLSKTAPDIYYANNYKVMNLDFLRTHYTEIENKKSIQVDAYFSAFKWKTPFEYQERLDLIGLNVQGLNILQFNLNLVDRRDEKDGVHYCFPVLLFPTHAGDLHELQGLAPGDRIKIYGRFYNLKQSEFAIDVDIIETIKKGGHEKSVLIDTRIAPTPTPMPTRTPTPGPGLWQTIKSKLTSAPVPTETATPLMK